MFRCWNIHHTRELAGRISAKVGLPVRCNRSTIKSTCALRSLCISPKRNTTEGEESNREEVKEVNTSSSSQSHLKSNSVKLKEGTSMLELQERPIESKISKPKVFPSRLVEKFEQAFSEGKSRENFVNVLQSFVKNDRSRRGHMELLSTALDYMEVFELERDLEAYNAMLNVFPRGRFKNLTLFDAIWAKKHPQVDLALEILTKMEENVIKPSIETYDLCEDVFGKASQPVQKCRRLAYWLTKLQEMFPHPLPAELPEEEIELSMIALERMTKEALTITVYQEYIQEKGQDFIVGIQSPEQKELVENYDIKKPVYVEGPYMLWIRRLRRHFYTLRAHAIEGKDFKEEELNEGNRTLS